MLNGMLCYKKRKIKNLEYLVNYLPSKQASKQADNLDKALRDSCSFKKIVNKVCTAGISRGQSDLWSFGPVVRFCPLFYCIKKDSCIKFVFVRYLCSVS
jgi:hypothetical protein